MDPEGNANGNEGNEGNPPVALVNADGTFSENWRESLPEDIRGEECLNVCTDFPGTIKQLVHAQKQVGKNKVALLTDDSTDIEVDAFYEAIGRPKTADEYTFSKPEGVPDDYYDEERYKRYMAAAHKAGLTQKQLNILLECDNAEMKLALADKAKADELETLEAEKLLKEKMGMAYEERIHIANRLINESTAEGEHRETFIKRYGRDPFFIEWASELGAKLIEHKELVADLTQSTPKEAKAKIAEIEATPGFLTGELKDKNPGKHARLLAERDTLYKQAYPEKKAG